MSEFQVNKYLTLRKENEGTVIYVGGQRFRQCKYLLLDIPINNLQSINQVESIDEAIEGLDRTQEIELPLNIEFWGHCSNLQVWAENNYDSRLLHRGLAFPLLKRLTEVGDPVARDVFKKEIIDRLKDNNVNMINWFFEENYLNLFSEYELRNLLLDANDYNNIFLLEDCLGEDFHISIDINNHFRNVYVPNHGKIIEIKISLRRETNAFLEVPECIGEFQHLKVLELQQNSFEALPDSIGNLKALSTLILSANNFKELPRSIGKLKNLKELYLDYNNLKYLPDSIGTLNSLEYLDLGNNFILELPDSIYSLNSLEYLSLVNNPIILDSSSLERLRMIVDEIHI